MNTIIIYIPPVAAHSLYTSSQSLNCVDAPCLSLTPIITIRLVPLIIIYDMRRT